MISLLSRGQRVVRCRRLLDDRGALVARAGLPVLPPSLPLTRWLELMLRDKKRDQGTMRFVLLRTLGSGAVGAAIAERDLRAVLGP